MPQTYRGTLRTRVEPDPVVSEQLAQQQTNDARNLALLRLLAPGGAPTTSYMPGASALAVGRQERGENLGLQAQSLANNMAQEQLRRQRMAPAPLDPREAFAMELRGREGLAIQEHDSRSRLAAQDFENQIRALGMQQGFARQEGAAERSLREKLGLGELEERAAGRGASSADAAAERALRERIATIEAEAVGSRRPGPDQDAALARYSALEPTFRYLEELQAGTRVVNGKTEAVSGAEARKDALRTIASGLRAAEALREVAPEAYQAAVSRLARFLPPEAPDRLGAAKEAALPQSLLGWLLATTPPSVTYRALSAGAAALEDPAAERSQRSSLVDDLARAGAQIGGFGAGGFGAGGGGSNLPPRGASGIDSLLDALIEQEIARAAAGAPPGTGYGR